MLFLLHLLRLYSINSSSVNVLLQKSLRYLLISSWGGGNSVIWAVLSYDAVTI